MASSYCSSELANWLVNQCELSPEQSKEISHHFKQCGIHTIGSLKRIEEADPISWIDDINANSVVVTKSVEAIIRAEIKKIGKVELLTLTSKDLEILMTKLYNGTYLKAITSHNIAGIDLYHIEDVDVLKQYGILSDIHASSLLSSIKEWKKIGVPQILLIPTTNLLQTSNNIKKDTTIESSNSLSMLALNRHPHSLLLGTKDRGVCVSSDECYEVNNIDSFQEHQSNFSVSSVGSMDHLCYMGGLGLNNTDSGDINETATFDPTIVFNDQHNYDMLDDDDDQTAVDSASPITARARLGVRGGAVVSRTLPTNISYHRLLSNSNYRIKSPQRNNKVSPRVTRSSATMTPRKLRNSSNDVTTNCPTPNHISRKTMELPNNNNSNSAERSDIGYNIRKRKLPWNRYESVDNSRSDILDSKHVERTNQSTINNNNRKLTSSSDKSHRSKSKSMNNNGDKLKNQIESIEKSCDIVLNNCNDSYLLNKALRYIIEHVNPPKYGRRSRNSSNRKPKTKQYLKHGESDLSKENVGKVVNSLCYSKLFQMIHKHQCYDNYVIHSCLEAINAIISRYDSLDEMKLLFQHRNIISDIVRLCSSDYQDIRLQSFSIIGDCGLKDLDPINCFKQKILNTGALEIIIQSYDDIKILDKSHHKSNMKHVKNAYAMVLYQLCSESSVEQFDILKQCLPLLVKLLNDPDVYSNTIIDALSSLSFLILHNNYVNIEIILNTSNIISILQVLLKQSKDTVKWHVINCFLNFTTHCSSHQISKFYFLIGALSENVGPYSRQRNECVRSGSLHCISSVLVHGEKVVQQFLYHRSNIASTIIKDIKDYSQQYITAGATVMKYACKCIVQACISANNEQIFSQLVPRDVFLVLFKIIVMRHQIKEDLKLAAVKALTKVILVFIDNDNMEDPHFIQMKEQYHRLRGWEIVEKIAQGQSYDDEELIAWQHMKPFLILDLDPMDDNDSSSMNTTSIDSIDEKGQHGNNIFIQEGEPCISHQPRIPSIALVPNPNPIQQSKNEALKLSCAELIRIIDSNDVRKLKYQDLCY